MVKLQVLKPTPKEPPVDKEKVVNPYAIARPHPTDLMLQRQTSFRGLGGLNQVRYFRELMQNATGEK